MPGMLIYWMVATFVVTVIGQDSPVEAFDIDSFGLNSSPNDAFMDIISPSTEPDSHPSDIASSDMNETDNPISPNLADCDSENTDHDLTIAPRQSCPTSKIEEPPSRINPTSLKKTREWRAPWKIPSPQIFPVGQFIRPPRGSPCTYSDSKRLYLTCSGPKVRYNTTKRRFKIIGYILNCTFGCVYSLVKFRIST